jgi:hypothetical protein
LDSLKGDSRFTIGDTSANRVGEDNVFSIIARGRSQLSVGHFDLFYYCFDFLNKKSILFKKSKSALRLVIKYYGKLVIF